MRHCRAADVQTLHGAEYQKGSVGESYHAFNGPSRHLSGLGGSSQHLPEISAIARSNMGKSAFGISV